MVWQYFFMNSEGFTSWGNKVYEIKKQNHLLGGIYEQRFTVLFPGYKAHDY